MTMSSHAFRNISHVLHRHWRPLVSADSSVFGGEFSESTEPGFPQPQKGLIPHRDPEFDFSDRWEESTSLFVKPGADPDPDILF